MSEQKIYNLLPGTFAPIFDDHIEQGTPEWHEWRKQGVGGSEIAPVMGASPWDTAWGVWERKTGRAPEKDLNKAMAHGQRCEPIARSMFEIETGVSVKPRLARHPDIPWLRVSLDAISLDGSVIGEIKCPGITTHTRYAAKGKVPPYYLPQIQAQLAATGAQVCKFYSAFIQDPEQDSEGDDYKLITVPRDEDYIVRMVARGDLFWECVKNDLELPADIFGVRDGVGANGLRDDKQFISLADEYMLAHVAFMDAYNQLQARREGIKTLMQKKQQTAAYTEQISCYLDDHGDLTVVVE